MSSRRAKLKGRSGSRFSAFPHICHDHPNYVALSVTAKALLHECIRQYNGRNNGDLCVAWGLMQHRGIGCRNSVDKARDELELKGWIVQTRQGGRNSPNLYALTFQSVDDCKDKLDAGAPVGRRLDYWKIGKNYMLCARLAKELQKQAA